MKNLLFISAAIGYLGGMLCAYYVVRHLLARLSSVENRKLVTRIGGAVGAAGILPASILAALLGGNFGGSIGENGGTGGLILDNFAGIFLVMVVGIVVPAGITGYLVSRFNKAQ